MDIPPVATGPYDQFARTVEASGTFTTTQNELSIRFDYTPGSANAQGWLDWLEVFTRRNLAMTGNNQLLFRDWNSVAAGNVGNFIIRNGTACHQGLGGDQPRAPVRMQVTAKWRRPAVCKRLQHLTGIYRIQYQWIIDAHSPW